MDITDQAVFVLKIILALGPLSLYFLGLGLVSSQARPHLVSARTDFALLATAFIPAIAFPVLLLIEHGQHQIVTGAVVVLLAVFFALLPRRDSSWVVYNCSPAQGRRLLQQAARHLGWRVHGHGDGSFEIEPIGLRITQTALPWLRSVTLHAEGATNMEARVARRALMAALGEELKHEAMLPSATGASLVLIGAGLLGLPMWYFFHNINVLVEAVRRIFAA